MIQIQFLKVREIDRSQTVLGDEGHSKKSGF